jgi:DHA2 family multidrug resistance protein
MIAPAGTGSAAAMTSPALSPQAHIPWLGLLGVLLGTFISTLNGRLSTFGLTDIRGAVGAGFDEGAWITTAQTSAQVFVTLISIWLAAAFGPRRILIGASIGFAVTSLLTPFCSDLPSLLVMQFLGGLATGCFIPLTLGFILMSMPPKYWAFGVALYTLHLELSLNISASLEGWYVDHLSWRWIFWQNVPLAFLMSVCLRFGITPKPVTTRPPPDFFALVAGGVGLALIYAALDQGNRLDWLNSGLIVALLLAGFLLIAAFFVHEARTLRPLLNLKVVFASPLPSQFLLVAFLRLTILGTGYLIPLYLGAVRGFRALEVGDTLIWIAIPQLLFCPIAALMMQRSDARLVASMGFIFICIACLMVGYQLTPLWGSTEFIPSQLLQALGQSFALSGVVFFGVLHIRLEDAFTFGAVLQTARLLGGEMGNAFIQTLARVRGQVASNLIGQHIQSGDPAVLERIRAYGAATTRNFDPGGALDRGQLVLGNVVRSAATTQAVADSFVILAVLTAIALVLLVFRRPAPVGPASPPSLFPEKPHSP